MKFIPVPELPEIVVIEPEIFQDDRGFFMEFYHQEKYEEAGIRDRFVQDNRSRSRKGILRGLHYQIRRPQGKLIWVPFGEVYDVAVDIRKRSSTFGKWCGVVLSDENHKGLYIPPGFAHGFQVLSDDADVFYKCTDFYSHEYERCIRWNDPDLAIPWPGPDPILSPKDRTSPFLKEAELPAT
jgi:dTDP-4-dehydrorhamnose 3,5-epimerase